MNCAISESVITMACVFPRLNGNKKSEHHVQQGRTWCSVHFQKHYDIRQSIKLLSAADFFRTLDCCSSEQLGIVCSMRSSIRLIQERLQLSQVHSSIVSLGLVLLAFI